MNDLAHAMRIADLERRLGERADGGGMIDLLERGDRVRFVAAGDQPDRIAPVDQRVQHGEIAFARHGEDMIDALRDQRLDQGGCGRPSAGGAMKDAIVIRPDTRERKHRRPPH